jgi:excisionase family DNA binding protein
MNNRLLIEGVNLEQLMTAVEQRMQLILKGERTREEPPEEFLTEREACKLLKVSRQTLKNWRDRGLIHFEKIGKSVRYHKSDLMRSKKGGKNES